MKLPREFYTRSDVLEVARDLLGKKLVVPNRNGGRVAGIIVETEAYRGPEDKASHAYNGRRTRRTETMYGVGGTAYVYFVFRTPFWCAPWSRSKVWISFAVADLGDSNMN